MSRADRIAGALLGCLIAAGVTMCADARAQTIGAHLGSWHSEPGYNTANPGLYLRTAGGWTLGGYRNSVRRDSTYAGWTGGVELATGLRAELTLGAITGYPAAAVLPLAAPSLRICPGNAAGPALRLTLLPKVHPKQGAHVAHLSTEWSF